MTAPIAAKLCTALSIRQPWAWLIIAGYKDIENRTWHTNFRGRCLVHASQGMTRGEYDAARIFAARINPAIYLPRMNDLARGGIIGSVEITDVIVASHSPWFTGPFGFTLTNPVPQSFLACKGALGFFKIEL